MGKPPLFFIYRYTGLFKKNLLWIY